MCGIAGFYGFQDDKLIQKFSNELKHRGPDGEGFYIDKNVTLLNRRLAIIDIKGGDQPIYNEDKTIVVVYNGEIYNFQELKKELEKKGHVFKTKSDTEIIVHGYEEWGENAFDRYNGMFAIVLYDIKKEKLILARDHFGIKPLYYAMNDGKLIFSSEIKPIFYSGFIEKKPNDRIIYRYLKYRVHDNNNETFFEGIKKLMPGQMMIIQNSKFRIQNYSDLQSELLRLSNNNKNLTSEDIEKFKNELIKAIKCRLVSEAPVGTCLSGGLDSSTVVSIVNKLLQEKTKETESIGKQQKTYSAVFPGSANDEEKYVDKVISQKLKVKSYKVYPKPEEFFKEINDFVRTQEEPIISTGPYAQYKVMEEAHKSVKVLLDGQGADEMMAGYLPYYFVYLNQLKKNKQWGKLISEIVGSRDVLKKYLLSKKSLDVDTLLNKEFIRDFKTERFKVTNDNLKKRLIEDIFYNSLPSLLRYEDRNSMRYSVEGRVPFLDFNLVRLIFSLSDDAIINRGWNKYILRKATENLLPELINKRRNKIGFTTPEDEWFRRFQKEIYMYFVSESFGKRKYFDQSNVLRKFREFMEGENNETMLFWRILNVEIWLREFFDSIINKSINGKDKIEKTKISQINSKGKKYLRFMVKTPIIKKGDDINQIIFQSVKQNLHNPGRKWFVVISEKIVAISQGRSWFLWDIKPGYWAKLLSKFVVKTSFGIGLGSAYTMQLAINEVGISKILFASVVSVITKPFGIKGMFYRIAGSSVRSIDGPTEYSLYPSNVSAKLGPKDPQKACQEVDKKLKSINKNYLGSVIIDANDIGRNVLGNITNFSRELIEDIFRDNPMGQGSEQTPVVIVTFV